MQSLVQARLLPGMLLLCIMGCGGGGGEGGEGLSLSFLSPAALSTVEGDFTFSGHSSGGNVEISVDLGPFEPARGAEDWTFDVATDDWNSGWHELSARVSGGGGNLVRNLSVFYEAPGGWPIPEPPAPPAPPTLPGGPVAVWTFATGEGADQSGNGYDATLHGATAAAGPVDGALEFDGIDDYVAVEDGKGLPPAEFSRMAYGSISIRFRYDSVMNGSAIADSMPLFYYGPKESAAPDPDLDYVSVYIAHGNLADPAARQIYYTMMTDSRIALCFDSNDVVLVPGVWYHYVVTIGPGAHRAYLDGKELSIRYNAGTSAASNGFFSSVTKPERMLFGTAVFGVTRLWWHLDGAIEDLVIHDRALLPDEIG